MKKLLTTVSFILAVILTNAQGNLQFNQVITQTGNLSVSPCNSQSSPTLTVPANKVWKIESMSRCNPTFYVNGSSVSTCYYNNIGTANTPSAGASMAIDNAPIWLKAGDAINFNLTVSCASGSLSYSYFLSIIEYNILP